jgi:hypothetical protein
LEIVASDEWRGARTTEKGFTTENTEGTEKEGKAEIGRSEGIPEVEGLVIPV